MTQPLLKVDSLSKSFGGLAVISEVSFEVPAGGRLALIGPNGAGKTTMFNLLTGVYRQDVGTVTLDGEVIDAYPSRARIGLGMARSFQNIRLMPHLSVVENVMLGQQSRASGWRDFLAPVTAFGRSPAYREAEDLLASMDIRTRPGDVVATLPYGIRKKIEVVRALAAKPKLLLLDEPAAGLNASETASLRDFLLQIAETGVTLLVVEHDMSLVRSLCTSTVVLNFGRKIYDGPVSRVNEDPQVLEAYLGPRHAGEKEAAHG
ncbi:ABC transporter ATP-binding protein [uncultured Albimonas sp.]|uniref:ABC transporter ATP-binding protein n=1 Tax=uncultured Albimonas sp. TaxID=1331701 RepID=UPI0030EC8365|tara:strand:- start:1943 stop:2728 length:786 start_codon:yes stop_codon:yes gene_type:complete